MPELPEVETVVSGLQKSIINKVILHAQCSNAKFRNQNINIDTSYLIGHTITSVNRKAKYILVNLSSKTTLVLHLGMSGKILLLAQPKHPQHNHLELTLDDNIKMIFNDPRRFGLIKLIQTSNLLYDDTFKHLGLEPLEPKFNDDSMQKICANKTSNIKNIIMNGQLIVGVGNIYASESLFRAGILPTRAGNSLTFKEIELLVTSIKQVLKEAIKSGGSTLRDYVKSDGDSGYFQHSFYVYGQQGKECKRCNVIIEKSIIANRPTYYCINCQI